MSCKVSRQIKIVFTDGTHWNQEADSQSGDPSKVELAKDIYRLSLGEDGKPSEGKHITGDMLVRLAPLMTLTPEQRNELPSACYQVILEGDPKATEGTLTIRLESIVFPINLPPPV